MKPERVRFIYRLQTGAGPEYDEAHAQIPESLRQLIADAGIFNYSIWRHEEIVVCEFDTALGFKKTRDILSGHPVQQAWTARLGHLFRNIEANGEPLWLHEVFRVDDA